MAFLHQFFKQKHLANAVDRSKLPRHIAIVMDGNGRWAKRFGMPRQAGHAAGSETFRRIATDCKELGIEYLTVYAFSTENWKRPQQEVSAIMDLFRQYLSEAIDKMSADRVRLAFFGDLSALSADIVEMINRATEESSHFEGLQVNICINYGGRDEILHATASLARRCMQGEIAPEQIDEEMFSSCLYSAGIPDPDLIIRPSGEYRVSNFLLWQSAYSEYYFTRVLWPDFDRQELIHAIEAYQSRSRRFGGI